MKDVNWHGKERIRRESLRITENLPKIKGGKKIKISRKWKNLFKKTDLSKGMTLIQTQYSND